MGENSKFQIPGLNSILKTCKIIDLSNIDKLMIKIGLNIIN